MNLLPSKKSCLSLVFSNRSRVFRNLLLIPLLAVMTYSGAALATVSTDQTSRLKLQHKIDWNVPFSDATFIGTHNSYNTLAWGYIAPNQNVSPRAQLDAGVRTLNFDIKGDLGSGNVWLCHGICGAGDESFATGLADIKNFIIANPDEVVMLVIEDKIDHADYYDNAVSDLNTQLSIGGSNRTYRPSDHFGGTVSGCQNPMKLTKKMVRDAGKNIVVATFNSNKNVANPTWFVTANPCSDNVGNWPQWVWDFPSHAIPRDTSSPHRPVFNGITRSLDKFIVAAEDRLLWSNGYLPYHTPDIKTALEQGAGMVGLDFFVNPGIIEATDGHPYGSRVDATIWSWAPNQPDNAGGNQNCAVQWSTGQWDDENCVTDHRYACQKKSTVGWVISTTSGSWSGGQAACAALGSDYVFTAPINANLNRALHDVKTTSGLTHVWINHNKNGTSWETGDFITRSNSSWDVGLHNPNGLGNFYIQNGDGLGQFYGQTAWPWVSTGKVFSGDFNGDGFWDVGLHNPNGLGNFYIQYGDGSGAFGNQTAWPWVGSGNVFTGDFNGDGKWDVGLHNPNGLGNFYIQYGDGSGAFGNQTVWPWVASGEVFTGDFNGDGKWDVGLRNPNGSGNFFIQYGDGSGAFGNQTAWPWSATTGKVLTGDFNGDGKWDVGLHNPNSSGNFYIQYGDGSGAFGNQTVWHWVGGGNVFTGKFIGN